MMVAFFFCLVVVVVVSSSSSSSSALLCDDIMIMMMTNKLNNFFLKSESCLGLVREDAKGVSLEQFFVVFRGWRAFYAVFQELNRFCRK